MVSTDIKKLVIERIERIPENHKISIGSLGSFSKQQLKKEVKDGSSIGKKFIERELAFIRAQARGELLRPKEF